MISSMTGFGSGLVKNEKITVHSQVKSVNGRFLEVRFRMPREYSALEAEIKKIVAGSIFRGTVDVFIHRTFEAQSESVNAWPNLAFAKIWKQACDGLKSHLNLSKEAYEDLLIRPSELIHIDESFDLPNWERQAVLEAVRDAVGLCVQEKQREGGEQHRVFTGLLDHLAGLVSSISEEKEKIIDELKKRLIEKLKILDGNIEIDPHRLAQEVLFSVERSDIDEELTRLTAHLRAYKDCLNSKGCVGKKLEFYTQELHREINTIGSKVQDLNLSLDIIDAKTSIERLREQVQNVE